MRGARPAPTCTATTSWRTFPTKELISLGWKDWKREWVLRTDMDRAGTPADGRRNPLNCWRRQWRFPPSDYRLVYRSAGGYTLDTPNLGCVFANVLGSLGGCRRRHRSLQLWATRRSRSSRSRFRRECRIRDRFLRARLSLGPSPGPRACQIGARAGELGMGLVVLVQASSPYLLGAHRGDNGAG